MAGRHNKVEYCSGSHIMESSFRFIDLSLALALSLGRGLRRIVARVRGVLGISPIQQHCGQLQGREVGAAQAPARTHRVPSPAGSPVFSIPVLC